MGMTDVEAEAIKRRITNILSRYSSVSPATARKLMPTRALQGKLYEAHVLADVIMELVTSEGLTVIFRGGPVLRLKQKGGPIHPAYPYFEVQNSHGIVGHLYTDIEFTSLSHSILRPLNIPASSDYHELDIALVRPGATGRPSNEEIIIGIECKNTVMTKSVIRSLLGYRRELSLLTQDTPTVFRNWPARTVRSFPPSVYILYCTDGTAMKYQPNCAFFDIMIRHFRM